jgi:hypothetical protein
MKGKISCIALLAVALIIFSSIITVSAQMQMQVGTQNCETCTMTVGADALDHLKVYDENGTRHYVECIGCALKLLKTCTSLHIETYCDWYGPNYPIVISIAEHGEVTAVSPTTATTLVGGGCTGNRVAYNQTAVDALIANGFSQYTMMMMKQNLPANTNVTSISTRALAFAQNSSPPTPTTSPLLIAGLAVAVVAVIVGSFLAYKKLKH